MTMWLATLACSSQSRNDATDGKEGGEQNDKQQNSPGGNKDTAGAAPVVLSGKLQISQESTVLAFAVGGKTASAPVQSDGSFRLGLDKDSSYSVVVVPGSVQIATMQLLAVEGIEANRISVEALGLDNIPTQVVSQKEINLGELVASDKLKGQITPPDSNDRQELLKGLGVSESEAKFAGKNDDTTSVLTNVDADGNGKLDIQEGKRVRLTVSYAWGKDQSPVSKLSIINGNFTPLETIIRDDNFRFASFNALIEMNDALPVKGTLRFPPMDACRDGNQCFDQATSIDVETWAPDGKVKSRDMTNGVPYANYHFTLKERTDGRKNILVPGDYGLDLRSYGGFTFKNLRPRVVSDSKGLAFIQTKFTVGSDGTIGKIAYTWKVHDMDSGLFRDATPTELALLFKGSTVGQGTIVCKEGPMGSAQENLMCEVPLSPIAGDLDPNVSCKNSPKKPNQIVFNNISSCYIATSDVYGTVIGYQLWP